MRLSANMAAYRSGPAGELFDLKLKRADWILTKKVDPRGLVINFLITPRRAVWSSLPVCVCFGFRAPSCGLTGRANLIIILCEAFIVTVRNEPSADTWRGEREEKGDVFPTKRGASVVENINMTWGAMAVLFSILPALSCDVFYDHVSHWGIVRACQEKGGSSLFQQDRKRQCNVCQRCSFEFVVLLAELRGTHTAATEFTRQSSSLFLMHFLLHLFFLSRCDVFHLFLRLGLLLFPLRQLYTACLPCSALIFFHFRLSPTLGQPTRTPDNYQLLAPIS